LKVLLINPNREQMPWPAVPLGLCMVATATAEAGHTVELLDLTFSRSPDTEVRAAMDRMRPEVVGVTIRNLDNCNFESPVFYLEEIRDGVIAAARRAAPKATIVLGGSAVNVSPRDCLSYLGADAAIVGEGELGLPALMGALQGGEHVGDLPGLLIPEGGRLRAASGRRLLPTVGGRLGAGEPSVGQATVEDLERSARSESWRWVKLGAYASRGGPYSIQTKRGCALKCSYCVYNAIEGRRYRLRSATSVVDEIEEAVKEHGVRHVDFVDSTFNLPLSHGRAVCEELEARALGVELSTMGLNPAGVRAEFVQGMKRAGFRTVMCTPESASDATLRSLQKGYDKGAVIRAAQALRGAGLRTFWFFLLGAPGETMQTVRETLAFCEEHIPPTDMVLFTTGLRVYSGTPLERQCKELGWFEPDDPLFFPSWFISPELDVQELYQCLVRAAAAHPNWMVNAETVLAPRLSNTMRRGFRMVGWKGPFWQHLPKFHRLVSRLGARHRGLELHAERMARMTDVKHRRA
jgi:anaerobic magnesium-protoporphyrin IX monomethyl ester cyclase